jgi:epoxide hydrolase 4
MNRRNAIFLGLMAWSLTATAALAQEAGPTFEDHYADVNGVRLHYASVGQGPLVLFLHGYPSFWYQWKDQMLELGKDHLAVAPDLRGYNLSSRPDGVDQYKIDLVIEDVRQLIEKLNGKKGKFVLVGHDWGATISYVFAMHYPELVDKLIIMNGVQPFVREREFKDDPAQRYASNYMLVGNGYLAPGEKPVDESNTREGATQRAHTGFVDNEVQSGHYTEADRQMWIDAWSQPGSTTAGLNYYRANHLNPPFNDLHPAATVAHSWSAKEVTKGAKTTVLHMPTLIIWGMKDNASLVGSLSGTGRWVTDLRTRLYPNGDHWTMMEYYRQVGQDMRSFIEDSKNFPKESVYRGKP